jgi:dTDP-glucose pyrophosphorylase
VITLDRNHSNFFNTNLKCIVLCAGKGTRMAPLSLEKQKVMLCVNEKPILKYVIDYWKQYTTDFIFIVRYKKEDVVSYVKSVGDITAEIIEEPRDGMGIAEAIELVEGKVNGNHIVVLGDCVCKGEFIFPERFKQGVGVFKTDEENDIKRSYSIEIKHENGSISKVVEKPKQLINNLCGMGVYFFNDKIFNYIKDTTPSELRNEVEITDAIGNMIDGGEEVFPIYFDGEYLNITFPDDLKVTEKFLC